MELEFQTREVILAIWKDLFGDFLHWNESDVERFYHQQSFTGPFDGDLGMFVKYGGFAAPFIAQLVPDKPFRNLKIDSTKILREIDSLEMLREILWETLGATDPRNYVKGFNIKTRYRLLSTVLDGLRLHLPSAKGESVGIDLPFIQTAMIRLREWHQQVKVEEIEKWSDEKLKNERICRLLDLPKFDHKKLIRKGAEEVGAIGAEGW